MILESKVACYFVSYDDTDNYKRFRSRRLVAIVSWKRTRRNSQERPFAGAIILHNIICCMLYANTIQHNGSLFSHNSIRNRLAPLVNVRLVLFTRTQTHTYTRTRTRKQKHIHTRTSVLKEKKRKRPKQWSSRTFVFEWTIKTPFSPDRCARGLGHRRRRWWFYCR